MRLQLISIPVALVTAAVLLNPTAAVAADEVGGTSAAASVTATAASYTHVTEAGGIPAGGQLELSGSLTPEIELIVPSPGSVNLAGDYEAVFASPAGDEFRIDMTNVTATLAVGTGWTATFNLRDVMKSSGGSVTDLMEEGYADELLAGGYVEFRAEDEVVHVTVSPTAAVAALDEFIIDDESTPPTGVPATGIIPNQAAHTITLGYDADPSTLPFVAEVTDPLQDWRGSVISDVRTWIGNTEVQNTLTDGLVTVTGTETPEGAILMLSGNVVGDIPSLVRQFLTGGTLSFRVNGGDATVFTLAMSTQDATTSFPDAAIPPAIVGRSTVNATQYSDTAPWSPVITWGSSSDEGRVVVPDGALPEGLWWDWDTHKIGGMPLEQGTFPITITASADSGEATATYNIVVGPSTAAPGPVNVNASIYADETVTELSLFGSGYFRPDNPRVVTALPIVSQFDAEDNLSGEGTNVVILDANGVPIDVSGNFYIDMWSGENGKDALSLASYNVQLGSGESGTLSDRLAGGGTISFTYAGDVNTLTFGPPV